jgi:hypothetical protein
MLPWVVAAVALGVAVGAWMRAGRVKRKLDAVNQSYWELRYDFTRLRSQVARLEPDDPEQHDPSTAPGAGPTTDGTTAFVPLSSMRKRTDS